MSSQNARASCWLTWSHRLPQYPVGRHALSSGIWLTQISTDVGQRNARFHGLWTSCHDSCPQEQSVWAPADVSPDGGGTCRPRVPRPALTAKRLHRYPASCRSTS